MPGSLARARRRLALAETVRIPAFAGMTGLESGNCGAGIGGKAGASAFPPIRLVVRARAERYLYRHLVVVAQDVRFHAVAGGAGH